MVTRNKKADDAFGRILLAQLASGEKLCEIIEREDYYIDTGSRPGYYFSEYKNWVAAERKVIKFAQGRVLDIGCGAGRHALYLQEKGLDVTGIDNSPGAVKVCKARGLKKVFNRKIEEISKFKPDSFDTVLMMGNNFGLFGSPANAKKFLKELARITAGDGQIIAGTRNPYGTEDPAHLAYHRFNRRRGRLPGHLTIRARFGTAIGGWFEYLLVSPAEMEAILDRTDWRIEKLFGETADSYFALIQKRQAPI